MTVWALRCYGEVLLVGPAGDAGLIGSPLHAAEAAFCVETIPPSPGRDRVLREDLAAILATIDGTGGAARLVLQTMLERVAELLRGGRLQAVRTSRPTVIEQQRKAEPLGPQETPLVWYEVQVVDHVGKPIEGIELELKIAGEVQKKKTDGSGKVRVEDVPDEGSAFARLAKPKDARDAARPRWEKGEPRTVEQSGDLTLISFRGASPTITLPAQMPHVIALVPSLVRLRLRGMYFETARSFLLPSATKGMRDVKRAYDEIEEPTVLVVGHADTQGEEKYNLDLSVERADSIAAFLRDDVDAWLAWYDKGKPHEKQWGPREDQFMLSALPEGETPYLEGPVTGVRDARTIEATKKFQAAEGLEVDGICGPDTRKALITKYMSLDATSLPEDATLETHGCGENFPEVQTGDGVADEQNRRVEIFLFNGPVSPPAPGKTSPKGSTQYPAWRAMVTENIDLDEGGEEGHPLRVQLHDDLYDPCPNVPFKVKMNGGAEIGGVTDDDGWAFALIPKGAGDKVTLEYPSKDEDDAFLHRACVTLVDRKDESDDAMMGHLHNLGFHHEGETPTATILRFQAHQELARTGALDDDTKASIKRAIGGDSASVTNELRG
jgi:outer membrane protein OmpA-like peptidoglycan-associated protein